MSNVEQDEDFAVRCTCVVVAIGSDACAAFRRVPRRHSRFWYLIAVGADAPLAKADRTIVVEDATEGVDATLSLASIIERLSEEWRQSTAVYIVFDQRDDEARALALPVLAAARAAGRISVAVLLGPTHAWVDEPSRAFCDVVLCLSDGEDADPSVPDSLHAMLSVFEVCWVPVDGESLAAGLDQAADARVICCRSRGPTINEVLPALLLAHDAATPSFVHVLHAERTGRPLGLSQQACPWATPATQFSVAVDEAFAPHEVLVAAVVPLTRAGRASRGRQLRALVADRAAQCLPHDDAAAPYARRLACELDWWTAKEDPARALLELLREVGALRAAGHVVGPSLGNDGGSLVAYVLGLSVFDPVRWDLPFAAFTGSRATVMLEASIAPETMEMRGLSGAYPGAERVAARGWCFSPEPYLSPMLALGREFSSWALDEPNDAACFASLRDGGGLHGLSRSQSSAISKIAPTSLEELAVAVALLRDPEFNDARLHEWIGSKELEGELSFVPCIKATCSTTRGMLIFREQVTQVLSSLFGESFVRAELRRRRLAKCHGGSDAFALCKNLVPGTVAQERLWGLIQRLSVHAAHAYPRTRALSQALVLLTTLRRRTTRPGARHAFGAYAVRLLRDVPHPNPAFCLVLRRGMELVGEIAGPEVRLSSDIMPDGGFVTRLREGADFEVIDGRRGLRS